MSSGIQKEIMIVEDTIASLKLLTDILTTAGYKVRPASDGEMALRSIFAKPASLVLLDIRMPGIDGYEVCKRLKDDERTRDIPVIFLSSLSEVVDKVTGFQLGAVDYITKPFQRDELLARVKTHLELYLLQHKLESIVKERTEELLTSENEMRLKAEELRIVSDYASNWEYWRNTDGSYRYVSPSCEKISGYPRESFYEDSSLLEKIVHDEDKALYMQHLEDVKHEHVEDGTMLEFRITTKDGGIRYIEHICKPIYAQNGEWLGQRGSNIDITEKKKAQDAIMELNASLEKRVEEELTKNREKDHLLIQQSRLAAMGEMIHNIAHQWRQPLNALSIFMANIKDDYEYEELTKERLTDYLTKIKTLIQKMSSTIDDFRDFFRPDRESGDFDVCKAVEDAIFIMDASLRNNNITVNTNFTESIVISGFKNQLAQTILNILSNAKEAITSRKIDDGQINIEVRTEGKNAVITIVDNGGGIPEDVLPKVFDPYFSTKESGSGIGLYMSKMIIERNFKGFMTADNSNNGARLTVTIPIKHEEI